MYNINLIQDKIYQIHYHINDVEYFSFSKLAGKNVVRDIITNNILKFENISTILYSDVDKKLIKYYNKLYKKNNNINIFKYSNNVDTNLHLYADILDFFDLTYEDLIKNNKNINLKNNIINKCEIFLKRYFSNEEIQFYIDNLNMIDDICYILSYDPIDLINHKHYNKIFWTNKILSSNKVDHYKFNLFEEDFKTLNFLNLNVNDYFKYKKEYKNKIIEHRDIFLKNLEQEYKKELKEILIEKINVSKSTLEKEKIFAESTKDDDLLFEINTISEMILNTENEILDKIKTVKLDTNLFEFWPDIYYPIPDIINNTHFNNNETLKKIDNMLSRI